MTETRIYIVTNLVGEQKNTRLIRASSQAQAIKHASKSDYSVSVASQDDLEIHLSNGMKVERVL